MDTHSTLDVGTQLRRAAAQGDLVKVTRMLDRKLINHKSSNGNTALHWSIIKQQYAVTKLLLTLPIPTIDVDAQNNLGQTPLHLATIQGDKRTVYRLLKKAAGKNSTDNTGSSPLDYAYEKNNSFIVTLLKKKLPELTFKDMDKLAEEAFEKFKANYPMLINDRKIFDFNYLYNTEKVAPYFQPGNKYSLVDMKRAIKKNTLNPHKLFCSGNLLQSTAVSRVDTFKKFEWLLEQGVNPNLQAVHELNPSSYKNTALHTLIANEDAENALKLIDLLITHSKQKFNFNLTDSEGKTCLCLAVKVGLSYVANRLIALKDSVDVNIPDEDSNTPLHYALLLGHESIAMELVKNKADKTIKNKQNKTPYELLISTDIEDVRDCLELIWINPDRKVKSSKKTYVELCMENRQRIKNNRMPIFTDTKLFLAREQKRKTILFLVAAATGDLTTLAAHCDSVILNQVNSKGNSALHLACQHGHKEIVKFLLQQPEIDLHLKNNEKLKAVELISHLLLTPLFEEKFRDIKDTLSKLNKRKEVLINETILALRNY